MATGTSFRSIKAVVRRRHLPELSIRVLERWVAARPKGTTQIARLHHDSSDRGAAIDRKVDDIVVQDARLWVDAPSRWRYEVDVPGGSAVFVRDGSLWWSYAPLVHAVSNESAPDRYPAPREHQESQLFHPETVLGALAVTNTRVEHRAGRMVEIVEGTARDNQSVPPLSPGADTYEVVIDRDRGVAMRMAAFAEGAEFSSVEITSLFSPPDYRPRPRGPWHSIVSVVGRLFARVVNTDRR